MVDIYYNILYPKKIHDTFNGLHHKTHHFSNISCIHFTDSMILTTLYLCMQEQSHKCLSSEPTKNIYPFQYQNIEETNSAMIPWSTYFHIWGQIYIVFDILVFLVIWRSQLLIGTMIVKMEWDRSYNLRHVIGFTDTR